MENVFDPHPHRNIVPLRNVNSVDGLKLEEIAQVCPGYAPGLAIILRDWPDEVFLMKHRKDFTDEQIFELCYGLLKKKGIKPGKRKNPDV